MCGGQRTFQLLDLHVTGGFAEYSVGYRPKLLHILFELQLSYIPGHIPHEQGRLRGRVS